VHPKLKVFSGGSFKESEDAFNEWMAMMPKGTNINVSFHSGESKREITIIYSEPADSRIATPGPQLVGLQN